MERKVNMAGVNPYKDFGKDEEGKKKFWEHNVKRRERASKRREEI